MNTSPNVPSSREIIIEISPNLERAVSDCSAMDDSQPDKPALLDYLGSCFVARYKHSSTVADLDQAVALRRDAVRLTPDDHSGKASRIGNLAGALLYLFERLGNLADIESAISLLQLAIERTPDGHLRKPYLFNNLGAALQKRFERTDSLADLERSISSYAEAVKLTPERTSKATRLSNLGNAHQLRFERLGSLEDLEQAITTLQSAVDITPDNEPDKPSLLGNLGSALWSRFERLGSLTDLDNSILSLLTAVKDIPDQHPDKRLLLHHLGQAFKSRFERSNNLADIEHSISTLQTAVECTPDDHPDKAGRLNSLGSAFTTHFKHSNVLTHIDGAISSLQSAVDLTPEGHPARASRLTNLGSTLQMRFEHLSRTGDMERSISNLKSAVELMPDDHPGKSMVLSNLGHSLQSRFEHLHNHEDLEATFSILSEAANSRAGPPMARFKIARSWAKFAQTYSRSSLPAFCCAIDLLPRVSWLGLPVPDQHALLADVGAVVRDAVAAAVQSGEHETAVAWAEQGRSIVWRNLLGLRTPVDDLHTTNPTLADRLRHIALQMDNPSSFDGAPERMPAAPIGDVVRRYSELAVEWENIIEEIRCIPSFESFLKPKSFSELSAAAYEGPVVILNVQHSRCDALVLVPHESDDRRASAVNIPLEQFSYEKGKNLYEKLANLLLSAGAHSRAPRTTQLVDTHADDVDIKFKAILHILWLDIAKPVVDALAYQVCFLEAVASGTNRLLHEVRSTNLPRIWWCATGLFAFLPIHAAGLYDSEKLGDRLSDYVVSSYTPSLTTILGRSQSTVQEGFQLLTVAQPFSPGTTAIPETEEEVERIQRRADGLSCVNLINQSATVARVQQEMEKSSWIHLACHGKQRTDKPMESGLLLYDGTLELSEIVKYSLPKADFAFLSACQTATGDEKVAEESVHLAAGMFLAGYRGVIATMWSIDDGDAPQVAEDVYRLILEGGVPDGRKAAYALHEAVKNLRESGVGCVSWVPFIHIGR